MDDMQPSRTRQLLQQALQRLVESLSPTDRAAAPSTDVPELRMKNCVLKRNGSRSFSESLYGELLLELPMHRRRLFHAHDIGDMESLRKAIHQLLGAVVYCDIPELEGALRALRQAIKAGEPHTIDVCHDRAISVLDSILYDSGLHGLSLAGHGGE